MKKSVLLALALGLSSIFAVQSVSATPDSKKILDFRKETIYFVFLDRFSDGDPSNNMPAEIQPPMTQIT